MPNAQLRARHGKNGADRALLEAAQDIHQVRRTFTRVVVASGDGCFLGLVNRLEQEGIETCVVGRPSATSRALQIATRSYRPLLPTIAWEVAA